jgi:hypothetical protein
MLLPFITLIPNLVTSGSRSLHYAFVLSPYARTSHKVYVLHAFNN